MLPSAVLAALVLCVVAAAAALCRLYSTFMWYDDDGYLLVSTQSFLSGAPLYTDVYTQYGPGYYLERWVLNGLLGIPVTPSAGRMVAFVEWTLTAATTARVVHRGTRDPLFSVAAAVLFFLYLEPVVKEPAHPQLLAHLLTLLIVDALARREVSVFRVGVLVGLLVTIKINLGAFVALAVAAAVTTQLGPGKLRTAFRGLCILALPVFPFLTLRPALQFWSILVLALLGALAAAAFLVAGGLEVDDGPRLSERDVAGGVVGGLLALLALAAFAWMRGTPPYALLEGVLFRPLEVAEAMAQEGALDGWPLLSGASALMVAAALRSRRSATERLGSIAEALAAVLLLVVACGLAITREPYTWGGQLRAGATILLPWVVPFSFLLVHAARTSTTTSGDELALVRRRAVMIFSALAVTHVVIGYPSYGTQVSLGSSFLVPGAALAAWPLLRRKGSRSVGRVAVAAVLLPALLVLSAAASTYAEHVPLLRPGAAGLRLPPLQRDALTVVSELLAKSCGAVGTLYGMGSLHLLAERPPPTHFNTTLWPWLLNDGEQRAIAEALLADPRSCVVINVQGAGYLEGPLAAEQPLGSHILRRTLPSAIVGPYTVRTHVARTAPFPEP